MSVRVEVWGPWALFMRPEMKIERVSYDVITPSAARGILESIYYHPGLKYTVDKIYVLSPIRFTNLRRNEVSAKAQGGAVWAMAKGGDIAYLAAPSFIQQRASMLLTDVHYVIEAHFDMTPQAAPGDNPGKFQDIIKRRLRRGACYSQPYLGVRECTCCFRMWEGAEIPSIPESRDLGWMLYDLDYSDPENIEPMFFRAYMDQGVIDLRDCEVVK